MDVNYYTDNKHEIYYQITDYDTIYRKFTAKSIEHKNDPYQLLICAKALFIHRKYSACIDTLKSIRPDQSTKILFQRQATLIKAIYLNKQPNWKVQIQQVVSEYDRLKNRCPGHKLLEIHHQDINKLKEIAFLQLQQLTLIDKQKKKVIENNLKKDFSEFQFQGLPCFLISKEWNDNFQDFVLKDGGHPGPITNFQLLNHIFEFYKHPSKNKFYTDTLMFPLDQRTSYFILTRPHWQYIFKLFSGFAVQRIFMKRNSRYDEGQSLIKTLIDSNNKNYIFQWQRGLYWQRSVFPTLFKMLKQGQLKQQTRNKQYLIVQPGPIYQPNSKLRYVPIDHQKIQAHSPEQIARKNKIIMSYDLQQYNLDQINSYGRVGLLNLGNTCYMNSALQCLSHISDFSQYFLLNRHLKNLNVSSTNINGSYGQVTCALADILKRLWFCSKQTKQIDPTPFKKIFGQRFTDFLGFYQQDAQQFLMFLLNCLHDDLNQYSHVRLHRNSTTGKNIEQVKKQSMIYHSKHNKSIISSKFVGFHSEVITCDICGSSSYRFDDSMMFHVQVPQDSPSLQLYFLRYDKSAGHAEKIAFYIEQLQTFSHVEDLVRQQFDIPNDNTLYSVIFNNDFQIKQHLVGSEKVAAIYQQFTKKRSEILYIFIYEIRKPYKDEEIAMTTFHYQGTKYTNYHKVDGFPRIILLPSELKQKNKNKQLTEYIVDIAIPVSNYKVSGKQQNLDKVSKITAKNSKGTFYSSIVSVKSCKKIQNFRFNSHKKVLGRVKKQRENSLEMCLTMMSEPQIIKLQQSWFCGKCNEVREALKTDKIYSTGEILLFDFKRFTQRGKITTKIQYPITGFDITPFIQDKSKTLKYDLIGVVLHRGSLDYGHYTAYCYNQYDQKWYNFDDQWVRQIEKQQVVDQNAYILVYKRQ